MRLQYGAPDDGCSSHLSPVVRSFRSVRSPCTRASGRGESQIDKLHHTPRLSLPLSLSFSAAQSQVLETRARFRFTSALRKMKRFIFFIFSKTSNASYFMIFRISQVPRTSFSKHFKPNTFIMKIFHTEV